MVKKLSLCVILSLWFFSVDVFGLSASNQSKNPNLHTNSNGNLAESSELSLVLLRLEAQEMRIRELEKSQEECKTLKITFENSRRELKEQIKSLRKEVDEIKAENCVNDDVWLLTPPLRGRKGEKGDRGISALEFSIKSCSVAMEILPSPRSTKQTIYPYGNGNTKKVEVLCDFQVDGGGWTVIQKRISGPREEFNKTWNEYKNGFGSLDANFWLGLENIRALTKHGDQELRIELEDFQGNKKWAKYSSFAIADASDFYRLTISGFSRRSTAGDSMTNSALGSDIQNGMRFSTKDKDNDLHPSGNCVDFRGGWWFKVCGYSNLNARYRQKGETASSGIRGKTHGNPWQKQKRRSERENNQKIRNGFPSAQQIF